MKCGMYVHVLAYVCVGMHACPCCVVCSVCVRVRKRVGVCVCVCLGACMFV